MPDHPPLDPDRWTRAVDIFERALDLPHASREELIAAESGDDGELARMIRGMLEADASDDGIISGGLDSIASIVSASGNDHPLHVGQHLGNFEIVGELGRGGMGIVYAARDTTLGRTAALKLLPTETAQNPVAIDRLVAEAQAASGLDHPNVATIYQVGEHNGRRFIAMACYEGETLRARLSRGPLHLDEAVGITRQVAAGLAAAHAKGLVHRDVKPANIFLTHQGAVKLLDFGIATLASPSDADATTRGTVRYMSPEQARGEIVDERSDVWSLAVVLYEMLTGRTPATGSTAADVIASLTSSSHFDFSAIPSRIRPVVSRALAKERNRRTSSATELSGDLDRAIGARARMTRRVAGAVAAIALVGVVAAGWMMRAKEPAAPLGKPIIAVLPVTDASPNQDNILLTTALIDEVSARLIALGRVRVIRAAPNTADRSEATHALQVALASTSTVPTAAITLTDRPSQRVIWQASRRLDPRDLRELSRTLTIDILTALGTPPTDKERSQIGSGFPSNAEAYREFLVANRNLSIRTPASVELAVTHYRRAAALDSMFASAYARQSYAYSLLSDWGWQNKSSITTDPLDEGLSLADKALSLDSTAAEPWLARAYLLVARDPQRFAGAIEAFQHAIALDPYNAEAFHQYGQALMALGRFTEAMAAYRRVIDLEPDRAMTLVPMGTIHKRLGRLSEGLALLDSAVSSNRRVAYSRAVRSFYRSFLGDAKGAREDSEAALALDSVFTVPALASLSKALWLLGDSSGAVNRLNQARRAIANPSAPTPTEAMMISVAHLSMGQTDKAEKLLETARPRGAWLWFLFNQPEFKDFVVLPGPKQVLSEADPRSVQ